MSAASPGTSARILVVNAGSTSLKLELFAFPEEVSLASAGVERIGRQGATATVRYGGAVPVDRVVDAPDHRAALETVVGILGGAAIAPDAVAHRVVHGGERLTEPLVVDAAAERAIEDCARFAPLHNPANLDGIRACRALFPGLPQVAVMDTGFHRTLEPEAFLYALPYELYERHGLRRYGFHGTSHRFVASEAAAFLGRPLDELRLLTCHLGGGASVCAIRRGRSIATSMGLTPLEGLVMGTRSGDLDPALVLYLQQQLDMTPAAVDTLLNRESGLKGISGIGRDMRELLAAAADGVARAELAIAMFCRRLRHYIGGYTAELGGLDALVFTGGIGENAAAIRARTLAGLEVLGLTLDATANEAAGEGARRISPPGRSPAVLVVPTDEELQIAREAAEVLRGGMPSGNL